MLNLTLTPALNTVIILSVTGLLITDGALHLTLFLRLELLSSLLARITMLFTGVNYSFFGTPVLVHASQKGYKNVVQILLNRGANLYQFTSINKIGALDVASEKCYNNKEVMDILNVEKTRLRKIKDAQDAIDKAKRIKEKENEEKQLLNNSNNNNNNNNNSSSSSDQETNGLPTLPDPSSLD